MSAATSKPGRNAPQAGYAEDQEFSSFQGPSLENIQHEKLTVFDSTANGYLILAVLHATKLLGLIGKDIMHVFVFCFYMPCFNKAYFTQGCDVC